MNFPAVNVEMIWLAVKVFSIKSNNLHGAFTDACAFSIRRFLFPL